MWTVEYWYKHGGYDQQTAYRKKYPEESRAF